MKTALWALCAVLALSIAARAQSYESAYGDAAWLNSLLRFKLPAGETVVTAYPLAQIAQKQGEHGLPVEFGDKTYTLSLSFGNDYAQFLTVREGTKKAVYPWKDLTKGVQFGTLSVFFTHGALGLCPDSGEPCGVIGADALTEWAFNEQGQALTLEPVHYSLLLDPTGAYVDMLRRDDKGKYFIGVYALADLQKDAGWFLGINDWQYGLRSDGSVLTVVRTPAPTTALVRLTGERAVDIMFRQ